MADYSRQDACNQGVGATTVLLIVFLVLKLTGLIEWSWIWVLSPIWITAALALAFVFAGAATLAASRRWPVGWKQERVCRRLKPVSAADVADGILNRLLQEGFVPSGKAGFRTSMGQRGTD